MKSGFWLAIVSFVVLTGCSSLVDSHSQKQPLMQKYVSGDTVGALALADQKLVNTDGTGDELVWRLEAANLNFLLGNYEASLDHFRRCEQVIDEFDERAIVSLRDVGSEGLAMLTNLNALPYRGWCRDRIALGFYKSLAFLGIGNEGAFRAQVKRLREEHQKVQEDYRKFFDAEEEKVNESRESNANLDVHPENTDLSADERNAEYLAGMKKLEIVANRGYGGFLNPATLFLAGLALARDGSWDNARIEFERLYEAMPDNPLAKQYYMTALLRSKHKVPAELDGVLPFPFPLDHDCVYVIFAHDCTAAFRQISLYFPFMVSWPLCEFSAAAYSGLQVVSDGKTFYTFPLADMDGILAQEFKERQAAMLARTLLNVMIKEAAYIATMETIRHSNMEPADKSLALFAASAGWTAYRLMMNTADTRSWETLPKEYQLTQLPMPADRQITLVDPNGTQVPVQLAIPEGCGSAIVFVNAPSPANFTCRVLPLK